MPEPLRVILNDRPLRQTLTGVGHYIRQILTHVPDAAGDVQLDPFLFKFILRRDWRNSGADAEGNRRGAESAEDAEMATALGQSRAASDERPPGASADDVDERQRRGGRRPSGRQPRDVGGSRKPWWLRRIVQGTYAALFRRKARGYALYHEPNHVPIRCDVPTVTTIHDLSVVVHPDWHPVDRVRWYEREFDAGVRRTRRFIAASEFTKREMVERLGVAPQRIDVTYQAPRPAFRPLPAERAAGVRAALELPERFFLYVGTLEPRKNVAGLLEAYAALPSRLRERHPLVIAGAWGWKQAALRDELGQHSLGSSVRLLGYLEDVQLAALYASCVALVWPTLYEGFGLPPLEAMACGAAVIVSNVASLPEVVGDAGVLLDPHDAPAWTEAMRRVSDDGAWRSERVAMGQQRVAGFSWQRCAAQTVTCYRAALA